MTLRRQNRIRELEALRRRAEREEFARWGGSRPMDQRQGGCMSMDISINAHVREEPLRFSGMDHGAGCKSVVIGGLGYPEVTFFMRLEHAIQIRDHFAALVEAWERSLDTEEEKPR